MTKLNDWIVHLDDIAQFGNLVLERAAKEKFPAEDTTWVLALGLLARTLEHKKAISMLLQSDFPVEARIITRCCLENCFMAAAICQKGKVFAKLIFDVAASSARKDLKELSASPFWDKVKNGSIDASFEEGLKALTDDQEMIALAMQLLDDSETKATLQIRQTAEAGDLGQLYMLYRQLSNDAAHPSFRSISRHFEIKRVTVAEDLVVIINEGPELAKDEKIDTISTAALSILIVSTTVRRVLGLRGLEDSLSALKDAYDSLLM